MKSLLAIYVLFAWSLSGCPSAAKDANAAAGTGGTGPSSPVDVAGSGASPHTSSSDTSSDRFAHAPMLPSCTAAAAMQIAPRMDARAIALAGDTLVIGTSDATYTMPKDGATAPTMLDDSASYALAVLGDVVYFSDSVFLGSHALSDKGGTAVASAADDIAASCVVSDGQALYAGGAESCKPAVHVFLRDGSEREIAAECPTAVTGHEGTLYAIEKTVGTVAIRKAGPADATLQTIVADKDIDAFASFAASDDYVYFSLKGKALGNDYLARVAVGGGAIEVVAGPSFFDSISTDGKNVYFNTSVNTVCTYRYDEASRAIEPIAGGGMLEAWDDDYYYLVGGNVTRVAR